MSNLQPSASLPPSPPPAPPPAPSLPGPAPAETPRPGTTARVTVLRLVGVLVVLALVVPATLALAGTFLQRTETGITTLGDRLSRVTVRTDTGDVTVRAVPAGTPAQVSWTNSWTTRRPATSTSVTGDQAQVSGSCHGGFMFFGSCSVDLTVTVPPGVAVEVTTTTGDVDARAAQARLSVVTTTGDITLQDVGAGEVSARATTGDVSVSFTRPPDRLQAEATTGDVTITLPGGEPYRVDVSTTVGDRTVTVPTDPNATHLVSARTTVGDIRVLGR